MEGSAAVKGHGTTFPSFPYPPYDIQLGFMQALYSALDKAGVGLFESPTGTGKTLSLICGSLTWLQDVRKREAEEAATAAATGAEVAVGDAAADVPMWMRTFASQQEEQRKKQDEEDRAKRIAKAKARLIPKQSGARKTDPSQSQRNAANESNSTDLDGEFLLDEVDEAEDGTTIPTRKRSSALSSFLSDSDSEFDDDPSLGILGEADEPEAPKKTQIIFCSRTHSQLTQFVGELHRTPFADTMSLVSLGSRRALCINDDVLKLKAPGLINERCLDLQKPTSSRKKVLAGNGKKASSSGGKCPFLAAGSRSADITRDMILAQPIDIEALSALGRKRSVCPYYASRRATPEADIILAPYTTLLMEDTRQALGLKIEGNVIIVDEAHNLADAINDAHSAELHADTAATAHRQLTSYFERFRTQLNPTNARNIQALIQASDALSKAASGSQVGSAAGSNTNSQPTPQAQAKAFSVNDFLFSTGLDNVNMFQLVRNIKQNKAVFKVAGYWQAAQRRAATAAGIAAAGVSDTKSASLSVVEGATGSLHALLSFLQALTNEDTDGRVVCDPGSRTVKFVLLNAAAHFAKVVSSARAVILASGTLSPLPTVLHLFPGVPRSSIHNYSCGHVIGEERLLAVAVGTGPSGGKLDFRHAARALPETMDELGRVVINACAASPGGVVVFFPSFSYADQVHARWATTGVLRSLGERKKVFREPRTAGEVESILEDYAICIRDARAPTSAPTTFGKSPQQGQQRCTGAVLFCVVGGKLAEGINFGDDLGRCVIMVGLPYPNPSDPELQERLKFVDKCATEEATTTLVSGASTSQAAGSDTSASRDYYSNLCMKAVNQCIGRAIRHRSDYAAVLLVDVRYAAGTMVVGQGQGQDGRPQFTGVLSKLPGWIQQSLVVSPKFGDAYGRLVRFYKGMAAEVAQAT